MFSIAPAAAVSSWLEPLCDAVRPGSPVIVNRVPA